MSAVPRRLSDAYGFLNEGRAWVGCIVHGDTVATIASRASVSEVLAGNDRRFASPETPKKLRAAFLLGGLHKLERELLG